MIITRQDSNGVKPLLQTGEFGYDNYPAGGDSGRVYVGTGSENIPLAKKAEMLAVDGKADVHIARVDNPHGVTKAQVGLGNVENLAPADMPISSAGQAALNAKADKTYVEGVIADTNLTRADKYLASQNVVKMIYNPEGKLSKVRYNNDTDVNYEVLTRNLEGKLNNVAHYVESILRGNTTLSYENGKLVAAPYTTV